MWPVGHVLGCIKVVQELSFQNRIVLLAVDSISHKRYGVLPQYKSGRHSPTGDPFEDYKIMTDLLNILQICTFKKNVFYVKHPEMESDDIIVSWIVSSKNDGKKDWAVYFNDNDILQVQGNYSWFNKFGSPPVDRREYIMEKYGLDLSYLPVYWKIIRGDSSDRIPATIPRFSRKLLSQLCVELGACRNFTDLVFWLQDAPLSKAFMWVKDELKNSDSDFYKALYINWQVVVPHVLDVGEFRMKRFTSSYQHMQSLLEYYQIHDYIPLE
jgi:5'-3' exonuclease